MSVDRAADNDLRSPLTVVLSLAMAIPCAQDLRGRQTARVANRSADSGISPCATGSPTLQTFNNSGPEIGALGRPKVAPAGISRLVSAGALLDSSGPCRRNSLP